MKNYSIRGLLIIGALLAAVGLVVAGIIFAIVFSLMSAFHTEQAYGCRVIDKEAVANGDNGNEYRVYTENCDTLKVSDSIIKGRYNSSNVYAGIEPGHTYDFELQGYRVPFFSMFKNVLEVKN